MSHWCKAVIEEVSSPPRLSISTGGNDSSVAPSLVPRPAPGGSATKPDALPQQINAQSNLPPNMIQYYQQLYSKAAAANNSTVTSSTAGFVWNEV